MPVIIDITQFKAPITVMYASGGTVWFYETYDVNASLDTLNDKVVAFGTAVEKTTAAFASFANTWYYDPPPLKKKQAYYNQFPQARKVQQLSPTLLKGKNVKVAGNGLWKRNRIRRNSIPRH